MKVVYTAYLTKRSQFLLVFSVQCTIRMAPSQGNAARGARLRQSPLASGVDSRADYEAFLNAWPTLRASGSILEPASLCPRDVSSFACSVSISNCFLAWFDHTCAKSEGASTD